LVVLSGVGFVGVGFIDVTPFRVMVDSLLLRFLLRSSLCSMNLSLNLWDDSFRTPPLSVAIG
jgi:hypothetical protein